MGFLNTAVECVREEFQHQVREQNEQDGFIYVTFSSLFFGFIEDMSIQIYDCSGGLGLQYTILAQNEVRVPKLSSWPDLMHD